MAVRVVTLGSLTVPVPVMEVEVFLLDSILLEVRFPPWPMKLAPLWRVKLPPPWQMKLASLQRVKLAPPWRMKLALLTLYW